MFKVITIKNHSKFDFQEECELYLNDGYKMISAGYTPKDAVNNDRSCWWAVFTLEKPEG